MKFFKWLNLQLFAGEGAGEGGGEGAPTGANEAADAGQQRLRELGVPEDKIRKRAQRAAPKLPAGAVSTVPQVQPQQANEQVAAAENPTEEGKTEEVKRLSWDEIKNDPEYNKEIQAIVQSRLRNAKAAQDALAKLTPALEVLARYHGQDPAKMDFGALAKAISEDTSYYESKALEMGVPVETAMKLDRQEREEARKQRLQQQTLQQQRYRQHYDNLHKQGEAMKEMFPGFDLQQELKNPAFVRMTSPNVNIPVADAYFAVHRNEIMAAGMQVTAQKTAQKISNAIQAGAQRPQENGTAGQAPSVTTFDYRNASPEQRAAMKAFIRSEAAHGRKVYPGGYSGK